MQASRMSEGSTLAAAQARRIAAVRAWPAACSPTRTTLLPPPMPVPRTAVSLPTTQVVCVPPPSIPRKRVTGVVLHQKLFTAKIAEGSQSARRDSTCDSWFPAKIAESRGRKLATLGSRHGIEQARSDDRRAVSGGNHSVRIALSQAAALAARLLSGGPQHSLVGDRSVDCGSRDQHTDHHQHSRTGL